MGKQQRLSMGQAEFTIDTAGFSVIIMKEMEWYGVQKIINAFYVTIPSSYFVPCHSTSLMTIIVGNLWVHSSYALRRTFMFFKIT